jgi:hypothetical protein
VAPDDLSREDTRIGFDNDLTWITDLKMWDCNSGIEQARRTFEEHQPYRDTAQFLWADRSGRFVSLSSVLFVPSSAMDSIIIERFPKSAVAQRACMRDITLPA